uniref:(northern house mosquito) hypothetical protein n=1 Tax=Culex pipiens TaxID=7175 RepID=A0A8D7ZWV1_CULPI
MFFNFLFVVKLKSNLLSGRYFLARLEACAAGESNEFEGTCNLSDLKKNGEGKRSSLDGVVDVVLDGAGDGRSAPTSGRIVAYGRVTGRHVDPDAGEALLGTGRRGGDGWRSFGADFGVDAFGGGRVGFGLLDDYGVADAAVRQVVQDAESVAVRVAAFAGEVFLSVETLQIFEGEHDLGAFLVA